MTVELGVAELAATRFAVSPLSETVAALQQLTGQHRQALHLRWFRWTMISRPCGCTRYSALRGESRRAIRSNSSASP